MRDDLDIGAQMPLPAVPLEFWTLHSRQVLAWLPLSLHHPFVDWLDKQSEDIVDRYEWDYHSVLREFFEATCRRG